MSPKGSSSNIAIMETGSDKKIAQCSIPAERVTALALQSGDEGLLITGADSGAVRVFLLEKGSDMLEEKAVLSGHKDSVICTVIACDGSVVCTGSKDNTVRFWRK